MVPASIETIFANQPEVVTGSAFFPFGRARRCEGGHRVTGRWQFASGCQHCSWYFVLCQEYDGDTPLFHDHGAPRTRACFVPISSYSIEETWDVSGLAGSGSHDVILDDVFVPEDMSWPFGRHMRPDARHFSGPLYRYPSYATGVMRSGLHRRGIAQGAIDRAVEIAQTKTGVATTTTLRDRPTFHIGLAEAVALVRGSRAWLKDALREFGAFIAREEDVSFEARANMLLAATKAVHNCARATDIMFTLSGANANFEAQSLQRLLREPPRRDPAFRGRHQPGRIRRAHDAGPRAARAAGDPELSAPRLIWIQRAGAASSAGSCFSSHAISASSCRRFHA
ncbi:MAG: hypothetical protein IPM80_20545 [Proteobacteria bacterium]|nr:hypothetical protein [Pseudomonadota bacterium]